MVQVKLSGMFIRGLHVDSRMVVNKPLYGWFHVEGEVNKDGVVVVHAIRDFPPEGNPSRWARAEGTPVKKLYDDGYSLSLELSFGPIVAYVWNKPLIAQILGHEGPIYVEGRIYDGRITPVVYAGEASSWVPADRSDELALSGSRTGGGSIRKEQS